MTNHTCPPTHPDDPRPCPELGAVSVSTCKELTAVFGRPQTFAPECLGGVWAAAAGSAVIYVRQAVANQHLLLDRQLVELRARVTAHGLDLRSVIAAAGSGTRSLAEAPDLRCLIETCADPGIDYLFVRDLERLGRCHVGLVEVLQALRAAQVTVVAGAQELNLTPGRDRLDAVILPALTDSRRDMSRLAALMRSRRKLP